MQPKMCFIFAVLSYVMFSCTQIEMEALIHQQNSYDNCSVKTTYRKGNKEVFPISETITVKVPTTSYHSSKNNTRKKVFLPDKEIGSKVPIIIRICGEFENSKVICDSLSLLSSKKIMKSIQDFDFSDIDKPKIKIQADLYRNKFHSKSKEVVQTNIKTSGVLKLNLSGTQNSVDLPVVTGNYIFDYDKASVKVRNNLKKIYSSYNKLVINYDLQLAWKNNTFDVETVQQSIYPSQWEMKHNYEHENTLGGYEASYYTYYNNGNQLGVVTFKNLSKKSGLVVEVYSDALFTNLLQQSKQSNVLFKEYYNEYLYVKIMNTTPNTLKYKINTHSVNHYLIAENAAYRRLSTELIAWLLDEDPNDVSRFIEITYAIINEDSFEKAANDFVYNEFKRQLSNVAGGNFLTDIGADAFPDIARAIYQKW